MAVFTHLPDSTLAELAQYYELGRLVNATGISEGVENTNYLLETQLAGTHFRTILTIFEKRVQADEIPFFLHLMQHLAEQGIHCPVPIEHRGGGLIHEVAGKPMAMVTFLTGKSRAGDPSEADCAALGEAMARLHLAAEGMRERRANDLSVSGWRRLIDQTGTQLDGIMPGLKRAVEAEYAYLTDHWPQQLPCGIIHADLFPNNVFFEGEQISGIIDFYFACEELLSYDLAISINSWCFEGSHCNLRKVRQMCAAYDRYRPRSSEEQAALITLLRGAALRFLLTRAYDVIYHDEQALVTPHDPLEYWHILQYWQAPQRAEELEA